MIPTGPVKADAPIARADVVRPKAATPAFGLAWIIYVLLGVVNTLIAIRVLLKALAANAGAPLTSFIYTVTNPLVWPFRDAFATRTASNGSVTPTYGSVFEFSSLVATVVYALLAGIIAHLAAIPSRQRRLGSTGAGA